MDNNIIKFRLPLEALEKLEAIADGKSKHEVARALLLESLGIQDTGHKRVRKTRDTIIDGTQRDQFCDTGHNGTQNSSQDTDVNSTQIDTDTLREELLAGIVARLEGGYLASLLEKAVASCSLPEVIGKLDDRLAATELSNSELKQEVNALKGQLAQIESNHREIKEANAELVQVNHKLSRRVVQLEEQLATPNLPVLVEDSEIYIPDNVVTLPDSTAPLAEPEGSTTGNEGKIPAHLFDALAVEIGMLPPRDTAPSVDAIKPEIVDPLDEVPDWATPTANLLDTIPDWVIELVEYFEKNPNEKNKTHKRDFVAKRLKIKVSEVEKYHDALEAYGCRITETGIIKKHEYCFNSFTTVVNHILELQRKLPS